MNADNLFDFFFQWHLTERCNLRCRHCYQDGTPVAEMTPEQIAGTVATLSDTISQWSELYKIPFSPSVNVTGGEPFVLPALPEILTLLHRSGFGLYILTNGTLINGREAAILAQIPVKGVQVSLEGPESIHDTIRGKGSFQSAIHGVRHLLSQNLKVTLNLTLSALNVDHIEEMAALGSSLGVQRIGFSRLVPSGRGLGLVDAMLSRERVKEAYTTIRSLSLPGLDIVTGDPVYSCTTDDAPPKTNDTPFGGCAAGVSGLTILPDGTLYPCRRLGVPIGNILGDNLRAVWATSPVLAALRDKSRYEGKCGACDWWAQCRGCRAIAYQDSLSRGKGSYLSDDPQCFIAQSGQKEISRQENQ
jgi:radical SAM protein with 4Fe4S-binding SPASM domain